MKLVPGHNSIGELKKSVKMHLKIANSDMMIKNVQQGVKESIKSVSRRLKSMITFVKSNPKSKIAPSLAETETL